MLGITLYEICVLEKAPKNLYDEIKRKPARPALSIRNRRIFSMTDRSLLLEFYETMYKSRRFDERLWDAYTSGKPLGMTHLGIGEEAVGVGTMKAFGPDDIVCPHHRSHAHLLARGCNLNSMLSETLLKETGVCKGKAGEAHFMDLSQNLYVLGGTLGPCYTVPLGFAYHLMHEGKGNIVVAYSGDGCNNEGPYFEWLNMDKAFNLPILTIIQNNFFAISEDFRKMTGLQRLSTRAAGFEIPGVTIENGNDVEAVYKAALEAAEYVRSGKGPMILEIMTWRQMGHGPNESGVKYKDPAEQAMWMKRDPLKLLTAKLKAEYAATDEELKALEAKVDEQLDAAWAFAEAAPYAQPEVAMRHIYAGC